MGFLVFVGAVVLFVLIILIKGVYTVPQGYEYTLERFGRYTQTLTPGLHFIVPIIDSIGRRVNMMETVLEVPSQDIITRDNAAVGVDGIVFFQILDASRAAYEVNNLQRSILNLTMTNLRTVMGSMDLDELLSERDKINAALLRIVDEATGPWGVKVIRIEIKDISPPADLVDAMARQMKAEREKRAEILEAEGKKQSQVLKAEGLKQSQILEAEGRREAAYRDAEAREREAQAEAVAIAGVSKAIEGGNTNAINYFIAEKYIEQFGKLASSEKGKLIFMPMEASGMLGALSGIAELTGSVLKDTKKEDN